MEEKRTSVFENGLIWFGAAVSIAEILTGTYFAPLGFGMGLLAIIAGHVIGCAMLFCAGLIGGRTRKSSMETVKMSFGNKGALLFATLNIIQLVGWTAIMIYDGAAAVSEILDIGSWCWCIIIGVLIIVWIMIGIKNLGKINTVAMTALFILTIVLSFVIFGKGTMQSISGEGMSFGAAVELSVAMPLSWLPLISDYTREAKKPLKATAVSAVTYGLVSCWMYVIGMGAAIFTGESDIAQSCQVRKHIELLEDHADLLPVQVDIHLFRIQLLTFEEHFSRRRFFQHVQAPQEGALAAAGRPDDGDDLALVDLLTDTLEHLQVPEAFVQSDRLDQDIAFLTFHLR
ncbi:MAG: cytosine permease [Ruminococcus sp.]|nr:cytosine permease [Ruminococcus sp.]